MRLVLGLYIIYKVLYLSVLVMKYYNLLWLTGAYVVYAVYVYMYQMTNDKLEKLIFYSLISFCQSKILQM